MLPPFWLKWYTPELNFLKYTNYDLWFDCNETNFKRTYLETVMQFQFEDFVFLLKYREIHVM